MKIAILGTENSHAQTFARLIKTDPDYSDIEISGVYGYDKAANDKLLEEGLVPYIAADPHEFVGKVDGVMVTARHGDHHYEYALPYVEAGCPAFIDKPFTVKTEYAEKLVTAARKSGALLCGGSSLKFLRELDKIKEFIAGNKVLGAYVGAPINMVNDYGGFYFYSQHLIEMLLTVFGPDVKSVYAYCPDETQKRVSVIFDYGDFDVMGQYTSSYAYTMSVYSEKGRKSEYTFDLGDAFKRELSEFRDMVTDGIQPRSFDLLTFPVAILHAIEKSYKENRRIVL